MVWRRANRLGLTETATADRSKLGYPKGREKPDFQTWEEIERNIALGGLTKQQVREQWDRLFLSQDQTAEVLEFVRTKKTRSAYVYPLMVFAAHTGARKSEIIRSRVEDLKFAEGEVVIHEKKKSQTKKTSRRVPMSSLLREVMGSYLQKHHPGGGITFCLEPNVMMLPTTVHEAFKWIYRNSKWAVLRGYHVFRHSFTSNLARDGADQREIDDFMGHQTGEMRKRYRHLFLEKKKKCYQEAFWLRASTSPHRASAGRAWQPSFGRSCRGGPEEGHPSGPDANQRKHRSRVA